VRKDLFSNISKNEIFPKLGTKTPSFTQNRNAKKDGRTKKRVGEISRRKK
jgi:hypothetical protein